ncbi:CARDB protein, partial [Flexibacter flexilis DSM 6793]
MKKLFTFFWVLLLVQFSIAQQVTVPTDNVNGSSYRQPFGGYYGYERSHMLYTSSEIGTSGNITAISFYVNSVSSPSDSPAEVYLKLSSNTSISASTVADVEAGATLVWSGTIPVASFVADSWVTVTLTTPFAYNTGSNLEVLVKNNAGGAGNEGTLAKRFRHSTTTGTLFQSWNTDNSAPAGTGTVSGSRPNIRLDMTPLAATTVGVSSVVSPASSCNLTASMPITIKIRNNGTGALNNVTIPVFYSINGGAAVAGSFTGTLASGATANYTFPTNANLGTLGTYTFKFWTAMPGDESAADDILQNYSVTKTAPATITPVTFTGYTGGNLSTVFTGWSEGNGQAKPAGTTSSWTNDNAIFGDDVARINLYSTNKKEWIYSPSFVAGNSSAINYKVALRQYSATGQVSLMDSDDSLNVRVSSDCGATWQTVYSITAANAPTALEKTEFSLPLSAYAGQEIRVGFFATEGVSSGTNDYWLILDDIELITLAPNNTGITQIVSPNGSCGLSASTPVTVKIRNFGTTAQTNIPVQYTVNGGTAVTATYTGSLAAGATTEFTFPTTANLSTVGSYTIAAKTLLAGDVDPSNDGSSSTVVKVGAANFTSVSFTGYTGGNLSTVFTGWSEGNGQAKPAGTTSSWTNDNTIFGDDVARINLYSTGKKEWIVSPLFAPNSASAVNYKVALRQYSATGQVSSMDSDDSLNVRVSSDCGATWQTVYSITAANAPTALEKTEFSMPLSAYAGQEIRVGFFATEGVSSGTNDYWLILDDIELITLAPNNTGITQIVSPNGSCGLSASTPVTVKIRNFGTTAQTNIPVQYTVNGGTAVTATYTGSLAAGATTEFTFPTTANLSTVGSYTIAAKTLLAGDVDPSNDGSSSTVVKVGAANFTSVSFTGYTGDNLSTVFTGWSEGNGQAKPAGTTSSWTNDNTIFGDDVARINLYSTGKKEWIVSPLFAPTSSSGVSFKMALRKYSATGQVSSMDSDDSLNVRVSSDCGATWQTVYSITAANAPTALEKTEFSMPIASYAGQEIRVGFFATEGVSSSTSDYWLILDDIQLTELVDANVGVSAIKHPVGKCGLSAATPVTVTLHNNGTASQTNFPVSYNVNGGAAITETFTGTLASGASVNYTFNTTADLSTVGTYALAAWTSLLGDNITDNDSMSATVIKEAPVSLIPVNFTGFTGDNLGTVFAGWSEGRGQTAPTGTISSWTSNTSSYPNDAVASLYMSSFSASKKEWLISPLYIPSATDGLSFKVALRQSTSNTSAVATMDTDDSLNVRVTTDCGATWQTIYSVTAANAPTVLEKSEFIASLTAFAGQEIRIGLFGTEGTSIASGYYILVDDIQIEALVPNNVGITSILAPSGACG